LYGIQPDNVKPSEEIRGQDLVFRGPPVFRKKGADPYIYAYIYAYIYGQHRGWESRDALMVAEP
jgi:hypothetical protein